MKRTPLRRVSKKRSAALKEYSRLRKFYLAQLSGCECCLFGTPTDIHHKNGRHNDRLNDMRHWMGVCRKCHTLIHTKPAFARQMGWLI